MSPTLPHPDRGLPQQLQRRKGDPPRKWQPSPLRPEGEVQALRRDSTPSCAGSWGCAPMGPSSSPSTASWRANTACPRRRGRKRRRWWIWRRPWPGTGPRCSRRVGGGARRSRRWSSWASYLGPGPASEGGALPPEVPLRRLLGRIDADNDPQEGPAGGPGLAAGGRVWRRRSRGPAARARPARWGRRRPAGRGWGSTKSGPGRLTCLAARALRAVAGGPPPRRSSAYGPGRDDGAGGRDDLRRLRFHDTWSFFPSQSRGSA